MRLPDAWVTKIVVELQGAYGQQLIGKFSKVENGVDIGLANFKESIASRLGGFVEHPEALRYALDNLPTTHCPNVLELRDLAQRAPKKQAAALPYKPTPEDEARAKLSIAKAAAELKPKVEGGIDRHWATHPRSEMHLRFIFDAAKRDHRFVSCIAEMAEQSICSKDGKALKFYRDQRFVKA